MYSRRMCFFCKVTERKKNKIDRELEREEEEENKKACYWMRSQRPGGVEF